MRHGHHLGGGQGCRAFGEAKYSALPRITSGEAIISTSEAITGSPAPAFAAGNRDPISPGMNLDLTDEETTALLSELERIIENDRYLLSPRIQTLRAIRAKIKPYPMREPLPPRKVYAPPRAILAGRRRTGR